MTGPFESSADDQLLRLVSRIVSAYVTSHRMAAEAVPGLIRDIYQSLSSLRVSADSADAATDTRQTVFADHLVCLEDGLPMKMLKRHLLTVHNLTPDQYREKWGLPADYPMVAPNYARVRSTLAKQSGLGKKQPERDRSDRASDDFDEDETPVDE